MERQITVHRRGNFTTVQNELIWDDRLRWAARAALIAMLSLPPDWDFSIRGMAQKMGLCKSAMSKIIKELEEAGYLMRRPQERGNDGHFAGIAYILTDRAGDFGEVADKADTPNEEPTPGDDAAPCPILRDTVQRCPVKQPQSNIRTNKDYRNIPPIAPQGGRRAREPKSEPDWKPERFAKFWALYPCGKSKQAAIRAWDRLRPDDVLLARMGQALLRQMSSAEWQEGIGIPYASTWLNQRRWEDEEHRLPASQQPPPGGWAPDPEVYDG